MSSTLPLSVSPALLLFVILCFCTFPFLSESPTQIAVVCSLLTLSLHTTQIARPVNTMHASNDLHAEGGSSF